MKTSGVRRWGTPWQQGQRWVASLSVLVCIAPMTWAQGIKIQGGSSSLFGTHGGSVELRSAAQRVRFDFGWLDGPRFGFLAVRPYRGLLWGAGDQTISLSLPTDQNGSSSFLGRGLSISQSTKRTKLFLFFGSTSQGFVAPFLNLARPETGVAVLFYERQLSPTVRFFSRNAFSKKQTTIQALEWSPRNGLKLAMSAGMGNNQRIWSSSLDFTRRRIAVQASYANLGQAFRRLRVDSPAVAETDRENLRLEIAPWDNLRFHASRQNYLSPDPEDESGARATVNSLGMWGRAAAFQFYGTVYQSATAAGTARALSLGTRRNFFDRLDVSVDFQRSAPSQSQSTSTMVYRVREVLTPRIALSQVVTQGNGQTTMSFGGSFLSNTLTASLEYQTVYLPLVQGAMSQFQQVLQVSLRMRLWAFELNADTIVTPLGQVRYTGYTTAYGYRESGQGGLFGARSSKFSKYIVRGRVVDEKGQPVAGAALLIGTILVFSDSQGNFLLRRDKGGTTSLTVALDQFLYPGRYEVVSLPVKVHAGAGDTVETYEVILRRVVVRPATVPAPK